MTASQPTTQRLQTGGKRLNREGLLWLVQKQYQARAIYTMGFIHVVAVKGVQYRFFGFYRIARKPVKWDFLGSWPSTCT